MELTDSHKYLRNILTADDLFKLRKLTDVPTFERINEKGYIPHEADKHHVKSLLEDKKNILDTKNVARIADLIQAEWKPNIQKAVTTKLRGRTQHMGHFIDGKIGLCPEEVIFLLENGSLELSFNDVPLSVESAYSTVLSSDLAIEKYQVYSYLSRCGFIVVQHQKHIDVSQQERLHSQNKCRCERKRKKRKRMESVKPKKILRLENEDSSSSNMDTNSDKVTKNFELLVKTSEYIARTQQEENKTSNSVTPKAVVPEKISNNMNLPPVMSKETENVKSALSKETENDKPVLGEETENVKFALSKETENVKSALSKETENDKSALGEETENDKPVLGKETENVKAVLSKETENVKIAIVANDFDKGMQELNAIRNATELNSSSLSAKENSSLLLVLAAEKIQNDASEKCLEDVLNISDKNVENRPSTLSVSKNELMDTKSNETIAMPENEMETNNFSTLNHPTSDITDDNIVKSANETIAMPENEIETNNFSALNHPTSDITDDSIVESGIKIVNKQNDKDCELLTSNVNEKFPKNFQEIENIKSDDGYIQLDDDESSKSLKDLEYAVASKLRSDNEETSDSDVLSLFVESSEDVSDDDNYEIVNDDSVQSVADNKVVETADDVMVVEINKPEIAPLAVIDLSSDDESSTFDASTVVNDDDEVLIINECRSTKPSRSQGWFTSEHSSNVKRELAAKAERNVTNNPSFPFPNLFKKRVICLPRPPSNLLPFNICLSKEAYTIDLSMLTAPSMFVPPPQRVWNSWRDLQERQNMGRSPRLNNDYQRGAPPFANTNFSSHQMPHSNHQPPTFSNNISPNMGRFGTSSDETNMFHNNFQRSIQPSGNEPMGGIQAINSNLYNRPPNPYSMMEDSKRNIMQNQNPQMNTSFDRNSVPLNPLINMSSNDDCRSPNPLRNMSFNDDCRSPNPWRNTPPNESRMSPNVWRNLPFNEEREIQNPWRNTSPNESCRFPNVTHSNNQESPYPWRTVPPNEECRLSSNPWINPDNRFMNPLPQNQDNPFHPHHLQRNFSNPWMENMQPAFNHQSFGSRQYGNNWQPLDNPYPCDIPKISASRASTWHELKTKDPQSNITVDRNNETDIQEVPINIDDVLWSKEIKPLVRPNPSLTLSEVLPCIQKTTANLFTTGNLKERSVSEVCSIEIFFDVYLPRTPYRKTCPSVPHHRIIVTKCSDPFPKLSDICYLLRKFKDSAKLQFAVVDNGDIAFYSLNNVCLPMLLP